MINNIVKTNIKTQNIVQFKYKITAFISFNLIQKLWKNLTSSGVLALNTTYAKKLHHIINAIIAVNPRKVIIFQKLIFFTCFFSIFFGISVAFKNSFSQKLLGTTLDTRFICLSSKRVSQFHSCSSFADSNCSFVICFTFSKIFEYIGYLIYLVFTITLSFLKFNITSLSFGSKVTKSYLFIKSNFKISSIVEIFIS
ncbi:MAG: hypothetical protein LBU14_01495 [Candidatus Peribacteria bacterium]|jgi:hypothetical protein|nr:hypothetical protein [Candidatus Peribacteria bacterium]